MSFKYSLTGASYAAMALLVVAAGAQSASAAIVPFDLLGRSGAGMRFDNENPTATGTGSGGEVGAGITFDTVSKVLTINAQWGSGNGFNNLTGSVTAAHLHQAANALFTTNGSVIFSLDGVTPGFNSSASSGGWSNTQVTLTAAQEAALNSGFLYLNAHTAANGGGEIRGNIVAVPAPGAAALLGVGGLIATGLRRRRF